MSGVIAYLAEANRLLRSVSGRGVTSGAVSKRQRVDGKLLSFTAYGPGQPGADGLTVPAPSGFSSAMLAGNVLPEVVSFAELKDGCAKSRCAPTKDPSFW